METKQAHAATILPPPKSRIELYWPADGVWFSGTVAERASASSVHVVYDDGMRTEEDLSKQMWRPLQPCGPAVLATALMCTVAHARLALPPSAFGRAPLSVGVPVPALLRARGHPACSAGEKEDPPHAPAQVQNAFYEVITGPLRAAAAAAAAAATGAALPPESRPRDAWKCSRLRIAVNAREMYEIIFSHHLGETEQSCARDAAQIRNSATCALRAVQCYLLSMSPPQANSLEIQYSFACGRTALSADEAEPTGPMRPIDESDDCRMCYVAGRRRIPLATVAMGNCRIHCALYATVRSSTSIP